MICRIILSPVAVLVCAIALFSAAPAGAVTIDGFAAMGASETAGNASDYTGTWVPYFTIDRGLNFGGAGSPYNVAVGGATSASLLSPYMEHITTRNRVQAGLVDLSFLTIGGNDFQPGVTQILGGQKTIEQWANGVVTNILTAVDTVLSANPTGMVINSVPAMTLTPGGRNLTGGNPVLVALGDSMVAAVNSALKPEILSRGIVYVDLEQAMRDLDAQGLVVGGVPIDMVTGNPDPTYFFQDALHPGAVGNGFFANLMLSAVNKGYDTNYTLLSDLEILTRAGLEGSYTGQTANLDYASYIYVVPEPASFALALVGGAFVVAAGYRRLRRGR